MSQDTFPFAVGEDTGQYDDADAASKKKLVLAGGVVAAVVLGAGAFLFLGGGGSSEGDTFIPRAPRVSQGAAAPKTAAKAPVSKLPVKYAEQIGRDPFKALYVEPVAVVAPVETTTTTSSTSGTTATAGSTEAGTGSTPTAPVVADHKLVLTRVYGSGADQTAVFTIDGKDQVAKVGTKFGPTSELELISIQAGPKAGKWTVELVVGDGAPFDVVTGVPTYVR